MAKFKSKQSDFVFKIKGLVLGENHKEKNNNYFICLTRNWIFQGTLMMDPKEFLFRVFFEFIVVLFISSLLTTFTSIYFRIFVSIVLTHTFFWTFNGHLWALHIGKKRLATNDPRGVLHYLKQLEKRVHKYNGLAGCVIFGSLARNSFHSESDLDIVFSAKNTLKSHLLTLMCAVLERAIAFLNKTPVEIYCYQPDKFKSEDLNETPIILKDVDSNWQSTLNGYRHFRKAGFEEMAFFKDFLKSQNSLLEND